MTFGARLTRCVCGHPAIEHYDSYDFCTWTLDGECDCEEFRAAEPEVFVSLGVTVGGDARTGPG